MGRSGNVWSVKKRTVGREVQWKIRKEEVKGELEWKDKQKRVGLGWLQMLAWGGGGSL